MLDGLALVESVIRETAHAEESLLTEASLHLVDAGGKRFRAMLVLLAGQFGDPRDPRLAPAAAAIELTHLATLFHDDVMDEAVIRRGHPSANSRWDNTVAILTGDFLFARASRILADLGAEAIRIQTETFARLVSGQVAETIGPRPGEDPLDHYWRVVTEKTGFADRHVGPVRRDVLRRAGGGHRADGDWPAKPSGSRSRSPTTSSTSAARPASPGKTPGTDLREGVQSLPVLHALALGGPGRRRGCASCWPAAR